MIDEFLSLDIQEDQMERESGVNRSNIGERQSSHIHLDQMEGESGLFKVSLMNLIFRISKEIEWKVKVVLL